MPNWCEGTIKIRGKTENIVKWLKEGLNKYEFDYETNELKPIDKDIWQYIHEEDGIISIELDLDSRGQDVAIEETTRAFITSDQVWNLGTNESLNPIIYLNFRQAWGIRPIEFVKLAKKYKLDFNLYGIERGAGRIDAYEIFNNGEAVVDNSKIFAFYSDFFWECPFPWMGG